MIVDEFLIDGHFIWSVKAAHVEHVEVVPVEASRVICVKFNKVFGNTLWVASFFFHEGHEIMDKFLDHRRDRSHVIPNKAEVVQNHRECQIVRHREKRGS